MIDIDVFQTVTSVSFEVEPNTNVININKITIEGTGGGGATNLSTSRTSTNVTINSDTGTDATIPLGNGTLAGATSNDYTTAEKNKLAGIASGAEVNVNADWNAVSGDAQILNKPTGLATVTYVDTQDAAKENSLGNPLVNGYVLSSTTGGVRSWVAQSGGSGGISNANASGTDTYTATISGVSSYVDGDAYLVRFTNGNTTNSTLNINGLGAIALYRNNDGALIGGDIQSGGEMLCVYNSTITAFQCIGTSPNDIVSYVTNADSVTITKGMPVYAFGGTGDRMTVKRAYNTLDATSAQTIGLVMSASIAAGQKGLIITQGLLYGLNTLPTSTFADGDTIYLGATAGSITNVKPHAPNHLVYLGVVTTASAGASGRMYVKPQNGYELDEIHNVQAQNPTLKDTLWYDNTVSPAQWKTASISTILGYTPANDASVVHLTGNETIAGLKTFTSDLTATKYLYSGGSIFPEFSQTFYINANGATHYFGGNTTNAQNNVSIPNGTFQIGLQTASTIASFDANKNVVSLPTATYPSLTELTYVKGVTSAIQTQLNSKQASSSILSGLSLLNYTGGFPFVRMVSASVFTLDNSTYLSSVGIANLTATGTPSSTTYLRGDNTWSSIPVASQSAFTVLANNTNASAVPTEQVFKDVAEQAYAGATPTWTGTTAPSGITNHSYQWSQIGKTVTLRVNLDYANAGSALTAVTFDLPSDCPPPKLPAGVSANGDVISYGSGMLTTTRASVGTPTANATSLRIKGTGTYEINIIRTTATGHKYAYATIQYFAQ